MDQGVESWKLFVANYGTWLVIGLLLVAVALIAYYSIAQLVVNHKANLKVIAGIGILVGIYLVSWLLSPYDFKWSDYQKGITPTGSGFIGGGLIMVYILMASAIGAIVFFEIKKAIKK
jgi:hypothetical protein